MSAAATKRKPGPEPVFYDVYIRDAEKVVRAIADSKIPVGAIKIDLAFLREWARGQLRAGETPQALAWMEENGLRVERRESNGQPVRTQWGD